MVIWSGEHGGINKDRLIHGILPTLSYKVLRHPPCHVKFYYQKRSRRSKFFSSSKLKPRLLQSPKPDENVPCLSHGELSGDYLGFKMQLLALENDMPMHR